MKFKFLLFRKEFLFGFVFCLIALICVFGYSVWYGVSLNVKGHVQDLPLQDDNVIIWANVESAHTGYNTNIQDNIINTNTREDTGPAPTVPYSENFGDTNFENLKKINQDTVGWIQINGTNINYPVVQTDNNEYYLNHTFWGTHNIPGCIFMDCRNTVNILNQNTIIYGHGELLDSSMFSSMSKMFKKSWLEAKENHRFIFNTEYQNMNWQIFSIYKTEPNTDYLKKDFDNQEQFLDFVDIAKEKSIYDFYTEVISDDKIITLSTCKGNKRVVVHAKLVK